MKHLLLHDPPRTGAVTITHFTTAVKLLNFLVESSRPGTPGKRKSRRSIIPVRSTNMHRKDEHEDILIWMLRDAPTKDPKLKKTGPDYDPKKSYMYKIANRYECRPSSADQLLTHV